MTFVAIWKFTVQADREAEFLSAYGSTGTWAQLFRKGDGYLGTELIRDLTEPRGFITIDRWTSEEAYRAFRQHYAQEYAEMDCAFEGLTEREQKVAEGTVAEADEGV